MIPGRDQKAILKNVTDQMERFGLDALILTTIYDVAHVTGHYSRQLYRNGMPGPTLACVTAEGEVGLITGDWERLTSEKDCDPSIHIITYPMWMYIEDFDNKGLEKQVSPDPDKTYKMAISFLRQYPSVKKVGVDWRWIPYQAGKIFINEFGEENVVDCRPALTAARTFKTPWEIDMLRRNARLSERAMYLTALDIVPGMTIADTQAIHHKHCIELAPDLVQIAQGNTVGPNFNPSPIPYEYRIQFGDLVRLDGGIYTNTYKADCARTFAVGKTTPDREELYARLFNGHCVGMDMIKPGVRMCDVYHAVYKAIGIPEYVRAHFGHSISDDLSGEEGPFISPKETRVFEPGMVMCLEVPFYSSRRQTYSVEDTFLITETGVDRFTTPVPSLYLR